jgi:hypothetical protein
LAIEDIITLPLGRKWFIYVLTDPRDGAVRYVGRTFHLPTRLGSHIRQASYRRTRKDRWICELLLLDLSPDAHAVETGWGDGWLERERHWIAHYRSLGSRLTNVGATARRSLAIKRCSQCGDEKSLDGFDPSSARHGAYRSQCRDCRNDLRRQRKASRRGPPSPGEMPPDPYSGDLYSIFYVWFKHIPDFPGYGIDTDGNAWSCLGTGPAAGRYTDHWRKLKPSKGGRYSVNLCRDGRHYTRRIYRLVLETFIGPCPPGKEACHYDDDQSNNRLYNLRWDVHENNCADRSRNGKQPIGSGCVLSRYDEPTIARAKGLILEGIRFGIIAEVTGVDRITIYNLKNREGWAHVPAELDADDLLIARKKQARGMSSNVWLEYDGRRMIVSDWAKHLGILSVTIRTRLSRGWSLERVLCAKNFKFKGTRDGG